MSAFSTTKEADLRYPFSGHRRKFSSYCSSCLVVDAKYDIRFPDIKPHSNSNELGLEYTISPVRDPITNEPRKFETSLGVGYVVSVVEPAQIQIMDPEDLKKYELSPIREGEYYFCNFFNDYWHMTVGPAEWGQSANQFMQSLSKIYEGMLR